MARNTRKTSKPNGRKLSKTKGNKKTMKKQKGGGDEEELLNQYGLIGRGDTTTVPVKTLQDIVKSINVSMRLFNARILDCEKEIRILTRHY